MQQHGKCLGMECAVNKNEYFKMKLFLYELYANGDSLLSFKESGLTAFRNHWYKCHSH
jgi:hypothetical protein